ncbi:PH domain-containing protein [Herbidospora mongoliensis]|uniref:PH domain-containing protein n=1 Tax=Herbidospora mongoliensis TaxID=688067 RepID=UPI00082E1F8F|nr:PH domain-containing protein [Herbidospora mongoliensis]
MFPSVPAPPLPVVWRPKRARVVAYTLAAIMVGGALILAVILPEQFHIPDRIGVLVFGCAVAFILHLLGRLRVEADDDGVTVVNAVRVHRYEWAEILGISLPDAEPWPRLDLADGNVVGAMGIQGSEKARAARAVAELNALIKIKSEAPDH